MNDILEQLINLSVEFEGSLRVVAARRSDAALQSARDKFDRMEMLMSALSTAPVTDTPGPETEEAVKEDEAVGAEEAPLEEPDNCEIPDSTVVESDRDAVENAAVMARKSEDLRRAPVTVEHLLSRQDAVDLHKAFTINDKFLFRRELFGGNAQEFSDTIDLIMAMKSYDEATEYLIDDLQWSADNETVKDFMGIVANYFRTRDNNL